ncbi:hypothetical protein DYB36_007982 [Aphanomyces astaci]|uniref:Carrier domain-containing protein n=1 Tax=Aphanomyces astaci TaxID=112090 RepID=A0A397BSL1_APHAT|nr:hypothetical protein DYB36_007982 [Aphanomyces astaci]
MVPAMWVGLDMLPHNCNGKVDKLALAALEVVHVVDTVQTDLEAQMAAIWAKVLGVNVDDIGRQSSFFSLGGDSLSVVKVIAASKHAGLHLTASDLLNAMVLWRVAEVATSRSSQTWPSAMLTPEVMTSLVEGDSLAKWSHCAVYPVTGLQAGMLLATMRNRDSYVLQSAVELGESMDLDTLQRAFHTLVERHELLRTSFVTTSAGLFQVLRPDTSDIEITNVAAPTLEAFLKQDLAKGFDLTGQLVRWTGVVTECGTYGVMTIHHVLYDGWTVPMLWDDLLDIVRGNQLADRPGFHRVVDFVQAQDEAATQEFWTSYLRGVVASPLSSLTSSGYWNEAFQNSDSSLSLTSKASLKEVHEAARRLDVTTAELIKFAWAATVRKYTRQDDVVFGQVMANRDIPVDGVDSLADIKKWSQVEGVKLMDSLFAFQNTPTATDHNGCWSMLKPYNPSTVSEEYTFELIVEPTPTSLNVHALYNPGDISWDQAQWILHEFDHSLWHLCTEATADTGVSELNTLSEAQTALIRSASFGPTVPLPFELLHHAFEARAAKHPDVRAVELDGQWLTYGDLNAHADTVASQLAELGVCVGSRVAVVMDRCLEFPIGLLATLKVGAAMMPLDVAFPGVPVLHKGAVNTMFSQPDGFHHVGTRVLQVMAIGFDGCQWDTWKALSNGATLVLRGQNMFETLSTIDTLLITPTGLTHLGDPHQYPRLKLVATGGEHLPSSLKDLWADHVCLLNCYGPSECAIATHIVRMTKASDVTIGKPISNASCHILDAAMRHVPLGVVGEIYLGGVGVSPGYINLPELTRDRFLKDPFTNDSGMMYRTGDLGRLLPNGQFEILGRMDSQVKLKGYRIELDEVANAMMHHPDVVSAAVVVKDKSHLVGYFTPATVNVEGLRQTVVDQLPVYMVPAMWVGLDMLPHNCNGKVDKLALAALEATLIMEPMQTELEIELAAIISTVLKINQCEIGRQSSFVALGGDSITAIYLAAALKQRGWRVSVREILASGRLCDLATEAKSQPPLHLPVVSDVALSTEVIQEITSLWPTYESAFATTPEQTFLVQSTIRTPSNWVLQVPFLEWGAAKMAVAYGQLAATCETLRTTFVSNPIGVYHVVNPATSSSIEYSSATSLSEFLATDKARGFTLAHPSFARFTVVTCGGDSVGVLTIHHALYDGWSISLLRSDLFDMYYGRPVSQRPSFRGLIQHLASHGMAKTVAFWANYLAGAPPTPCLSDLVPPSSCPEPNDLSLATHAALPRLPSVIRGLGVTMSTVVLLSWAMALQHHTNRHDIVFGQVLANRNLDVDGIDQYDHLIWELTLTFWGVGSMQFDTDLAFHRSHDLAMDDNVKINGGCNDTYPAAVYAIEVAVTPTTSGVAIRAAYDRSRTDQVAVSRLVATMASYLHEWDHSLRQ